MFVHAIQGRCIPSADTGRPPRAAPEVGLEELATEELTAQLQSLFEAADTNGNGAISADEFQELLVLSGLGYSEEAGSQLFHQADLNDDGKLVYAEFEVALMDILEHSQLQLGEKQLGWRLLTPNCEPPAGGWPVVYYLHGGGFSSVAAREAALDGSIEPELTAAVERGELAVAVLSYRLTSEAGQWGPADEPLPVTWPAQYEDVISQIQHIISSAEQLQLSSSKAAVWGASAGGYLAAMVATRGMKEFGIPLKAAVDFYGPIVFSELMNDVSRQPASLCPPWVLSDGSSWMEPMTDGEPESSLMGFAVNPTADHSPFFQWSAINTAVHSNPPQYAEYGERYPAAMQPTREYDTTHKKTMALASANPCVHIHPEMAPMFIAHGDNDPIVPTKQSVRLHTALQHYGIQSELHIVPNGSHGAAFQKCAGRAPGSMPVEAALAFVSRHLAGHEEQEPPTPILARRPLKEPVYPTPTDHAIPYSHYLRADSHSRASARFGRGPIATRAFLKTDVTTKEI